MAVQPLPLAIAGTVLISSSAVVMQLAGSSASLTALGRCGFALPVLAVLVWVDRRRGAAPLPSRNRWLARLAGVFLAADLIVWSHAISDIGAGLGTVVPNLQVLILSLLGWLVLGERPRRSLLLASPVMLAGLALVGGLTGTHAYGADPAAGVAAGAVVAVLYSVYIFTLRQAMAAAGPARGVVTGAAAGADDVPPRKAWARHRWRRCSRRRWARRWHRWYWGCACTTSGLGTPGQPRSGQHSAGSRCSRSPPRSSAGY